MTGAIVRIAGAVSALPEKRLKRPFDFELYPGECVAVTGNNGAGKTTAAEMILDKYPLSAGTAEYDFGESGGSPVFRNSDYLAFRDAYGAAADTGYYYQQRWNHGEQEGIPTAGEWLYGGKPLSGSSFHSGLGEFFSNQEEILGKKIIFLSGGELRRLHLVKVLQGEPRLLVLDEPFIGLDVRARTELERMLESLARRVSLILICARPEEIPPFATHVLAPEKDGRFVKRLRADFFRTRLPGRPAAEEVEISRKLEQLPYGYYTGDAFFTGGLPEKEAVSEEVIRMREVTLCYGKRLILDNVSWTVRSGERWGLLGPNGSGKSTLLGLVCGDNPQAYACDISLFGRRRGSGESIWDIKKRIGYVSPEMHRAFRKNIPAGEVVAGGFREVPAVSVRLPEELLPYRDFWMDLFGIGALKERPFTKLSSGEQRLVLLARAFVKDPRLLILDEPMHGLDDENRRRVRTILAAFCRRRGKTLIMVTHYPEELPGCVDRILELPGRER